MTTDTLTAERLAAIEEELTEAAPAGPLFDDDGCALSELDMGAVRALVASAREAERLRAEVEALRRESVALLRDVRAGLQDILDNGMPTLAHFYIKTIDSALKEHTNER